MLPIELRLISLRHCYIHLPEVFVSKQPNLKPNGIVSIKSVQSDVEIKIQWNGLTTGGDFAQLDLDFAQANNFKDELVVLNFEKDLLVPYCSSCRVELVNASDYNILSEHNDANVLDNCRLVSQGLVIPIRLLQHVKVMVKVLEIRPDKDHGLLTKQTEMQYQHSSDHIPESKANDEDIPIKDPITFVSCSLGIDYKLKLNLGPLLVVGDRGSGKTHFMKTVISNYKKFSSEIYNCKQFRGKRPENIRKKLNELLSEALDKQPSILVLDDIDSILALDSKQEQEKGADALYKSRLVDIFCHLLKQLERTSHVRGRRVLLLAAAKSLEALDRRISEQIGRAYFGDIIKIGNPSFEKRIEIIKNLIQEHKRVRNGLTREDLELTSKKCSSFMPTDLRRLVERSIIRACSRSLLDFDSEPVTLLLIDVIESLEGYTPSSLRGVALQQRSDKTFDGVGGMRQIKETLMKIVLLQIKYPNLYKKCPMRPQTSILLYGPPGCGKTLIAEALTNQDSINSICVRGPELLSKYIGASEAAVRDLFRRAELAKPCVIFFDEFESLVAKRGADSTGVTDRIVNQFLTLMDGVEKLSTNIFILAASSRPDMIDPAILRPGRLDKHLYCGVPNQEDRLAILRVLSRNIELDDVNESHLVELSHRLEGFTGADIQSLLYSAQLKSLHQTVDKNVLDHKNKLKNHELIFFIKQQHLESSFAEMKSEVDVRLRKLFDKYPIDFRRGSVPTSTRATLI